MSTLDYFLKANLYLALFYGCYWFWLRNHTFFRLNRAYLLLAILGSLLLPLAELPHETAETISLPVGVIVLPAVIAPPADDPFLNQETVALGLYGLIAAGLVVRLLLRIVSVVRLVRRSKRRPMDGYTLVSPDDEAVPSFSFFRFLVLSRSDAQANEEVIRRHELVHIRQWHSLDILLLELVRSLFWINPVLYLYNQSIRQVHEFLADEQADDKRQYASFLVSYAFGLRPDQLTNGFFNPSLLKQRIIMLHQRATSRWAVGKYLLVAPLALGLLAMTTAPRQVTELISPISQEVAEAMQTIDPRSVSSGNQLAGGSVASADSIPAPRQVKVRISKSGDTDPEFPGGPQRLAEYLAKNRVYPTAAAQASVGGEVHVRFTVNEDGRLSDIQIVKGIGFGCDREAIRLISEMPAWKPGRKNGTAVAMAYTIPVKFTLPPLVREAPLTLSLHSTRIEAPSLPPPLYVVDGKLLPTGAKLDMTLTNEIKHISVFKGPDASALYGEAGKNGVIVITTNKFTRKQQEPLNIITSRESQNLDDVLYVIDGEIADGSQFKDKKILRKDGQELNPNDIKSISVLKDKSAVGLYGEAGRNGVIQIQTKK